MDLAGPLIYSRNYAYLCLILDNASRYLHLVPLRNAKSKGVIKALEDVMYKNGYVRTLTTDNGPCFVSGEFRRFVVNNGIRHIRTSPYTASSNAVERYIRVVKSSLKMYCARRQTTWVEHIGPVQFALNAAVHSELRFSPFRYHGREPVDPLVARWHIQDADIRVEDRDVWVQVYDNMERVWEERKRVFNQRRDPVSYKVGDEVLCRNQARTSFRDKARKALLPNWVGPYHIKRFTNRNTVMLGDDKPDTNIKCHVSWLKAYKARE
jgi:transposase InsO family protein